MVQRKMNRKTAECKAFTLIELLVVITVIALLVSILMPALGKAKESARKVVCMSNGKQMGIAVQMFTSESNGMLPGPNTTGLNQTIYDKPNAPTQNTDWMSPLLGKELGLPIDKDERLVRLCNNDMACPSNRTKYDYLYDGGSNYDGMIGNYRVQEITQFSYSAALAFLTYPAGSKPRPYVTDSEYANASVPNNYVPKYDKIGRPAQKVFAMEGSRYLDSSSMEVSINTLEWQDDGGNFVCYGPTTPIIGGSGGGDPFRLNKNQVGANEFEMSVVEGTEKYAYRHKTNGKPSMDLVFYDGHVSHRTYDQTLDISMYWPRGTEVRNGAATFDPTVQRQTMFKIK